MALQKDLSECPSKITLGNFLAFDDAPFHYILIVIRI